jgi:ketosteroid isomerase-like protein
MILGRYLDLRSSVPSLTIEIVAANQTKDEVIKSVTTGKATVEGITFSDTTVRVYGNTALVKGKVDIVNNTDGKSTPAHLNILHVWIKGPHGWQMVARQATRLP